MTHPIPSPDRENCIGNIPSQHEAMIIRAALETGIQIRVEREAVDSNGRPDPGRVAVFALQPTRDHGPFWARYYALRMEHEPAR